MKRLELKAYIKSINKVVDVHNINFLQEEIGFTDPQTTKYTFVKFEDVELMENTGVLDTHGNDIFENDIVKIKFSSGNEHICKIIYQDGIYILQELNNVGQEYLVRLSQNLNLTVIGNVYDKNLQKTGEK